MPTGSMKKFKKLLKQGQKEKMTRADWRSVAGTLGSDAGRGTRRKAKNPAKGVRLSNFTGTVKKNANGTISITGRAKPKRNPSKSSARRRVSRALTKYVRGQR